MPELWRDGIDAATGDVVCSHDLGHAAGAGLARRPRAAWRGRGDAVGGAIEPGEDLRLRDWAEYFCRYARDMLPFAARETRRPAGDNAVYRARRSPRRATSTATASGSRRCTARCGRGLPPAALARARRLPGPLGRASRAFVRQRLVHGREYGRQRGARFSTARNVAGVLARRRRAARARGDGRSAKSSRGGGCGCGSWRRRRCCSPTTSPGRRGRRRACG